MGADAAVQEGPGYDRIGLAFGQFEPGVLEIDDRLAEGLALLAIGNGAFDRALDRADRAAADDQPLLRQLLHQLNKALPLDAAQDVFGGHGDVVEKQFRRVGGFQPDLVQVAPPRKALGAVGFDGDQ